MEVVASLSQGRTAAAQCGLFTHKSVPVIFKPPCKCSSEVTWHFITSYQLPKHVIMKELSQRLGEYESSQIREPQFQVSVRRNHARSDRK